MVGAGWATAGGTTSGGGVITDGGVVAAGGVVVAGGLNRGSGTFTVEAGAAGGGTNAGFGATSTQCWAPPRFRCDWSRIATR